MNHFIWKKKKFQLNREETNALKVLLPYWGLSIYSDQQEIIPGLTHCKVSLSGIDPSSFDYLKNMLQHTGVSLSKANKEMTTDVEFLIQYEEALSYPISLTLMNMTYNLRPSSSYRDLMKVIHQQIWLPTVCSRITVRIHPTVKQHTVQWLSYLIIQSFLRKTFQPLDAISISMYTRLVDRILANINGDFAQFQQKKRTAQKEWPDLPKVPLHLNKTTSKTPIQTKKDALNPFPQKPTNKEITTFNPFKFQSKAKESKIINPFQNKN